MSAIFINKNKLLFPHAFMGDTKHKNIVLLLNVIYVG
jgi:hypothetical protein